MMKKQYMTPTSEVAEMGCLSILCQSSMGDIGGGSFTSGGGDGSDPIGNGDDFNWGF